MAPMPPEYEQLGERPFSFYPAIAGIEHNEWRLGRATWSELEVVNAKTGQTLWIARRYLGAVSPVNDPVAIVGLTKDLEFKGGTVWPLQRRVVEMPLAVNAPYAAPDPARQEPTPLPINRLEGATERYVGKMVLGAMLVIVMGLFGVVLVTREKTVVPRRSYSNVDQDFLNLRAQDDYHSVVHRLGPPASVRSRSGTTEILYQVLEYPKRGYSVVLMGADRDSLRYIGSMDREWRVLHYVDRPDGRDMGSLLRSLQRF